MAKKRGSLESQVKRLRLREGDIVVVRNPDDLQALMRAKLPPGMPNCPVVVVRESIHRLSKEYIRKLLEKR